MTLFDRVADLTFEVDRLNAGIDRLLELRAAWDAENSRAVMGQFEYYPRAAGYYGAILDALSDLVGAEKVATILQRVAPEVTPALPPRVINPPDLVAYADDPAECDLCLTDHFCPRHREADLA